MNRFRVVDTLNESKAPVSKVTVYHPSGRTIKVTPKQARARVEYERKKRREREGTPEEVRKDESTMNQENFEEAYIRANAQLAFVIAEGKTKLQTDAEGMARSRAIQTAKKRGKTSAAVTDKEVRRAAARSIETGEVFSGQTTPEYKQEHGGNAPTLVITHKVSRTSKGRPVRRLAGPKGPLPGSKGRRQQTQGN